MPWGLFLVVAGLVLVFATSYVTLGWILFAIGVVLTLVVWLIFGLVLSAFAKEHKRITKEFEKFGKF